MKLDRSTYQRLGYSPGANRSFAESNAREQAAQAQVREVAHTHNRIDPEHAALVAQAYNEGSITAEQARTLIRRLPSYVGPEQIKALWEEDLPR